MKAPDSFVRPPRYPVLETGISAVTLSEAVTLIAGWISRRESYYVNVCTADVVLQAHDNPDLAAIINASGLATPDGVPLVWIGRWRGLPVGRVYGPDLMLALCECGIKHGWKHYFYGGTPTVLADLEVWTRRRLRCLIWQQWKCGSTRFTELVKRGADRTEAALLAGSSGGPWHLSRTPLLHQLFSTQWFAAHGLPKFHA